MPRTRWCHREGGRRAPGDIRHGQVAAPLLQAGHGPCPVHPQLSLSPLSPSVLPPFSSPQVSGSYKMVPLFPMLFPGQLLPDTEQDLIATAFEKNYSVIASYSAIPASSHISLDIQGHGEAPSAPGLGGMGGFQHSHSAAPISLSCRDGRDACDEHPPCHHTAPRLAPPGAAHAQALEVHR